MPPSQSVPFVLKYGTISDSRSRPLSLVKTAGVSLARRSWASGTRTEVVLRARVGTAAMALAVVAAAEAARVGAVGGGLGRWKGQCSELTAKYKKYGLSLCRL